MNLSATLSTALTGLNAAQASIGAVANNIANANTEGYVRKTLSQESMVLDHRGAGVDVGLPERVVDEFLIEEVRRQATVTGRSQILDRYHSLAQDAFGNPSSGNDLGSLVAGLSAALEAFSVDHETSALAHDVVVQATELTGSVDQLADQVVRLRNEADKHIDRVTDAINEDLQTIHDLNIEIARARNTGDQSAELLDKRDLAVKQLAEKIEIDTYRQDDGIIAVYTAGGDALLDSTPRVVHYDAAGTLAPGATVPPISIFRQNQIDPATDKPYDINAGVELVSSGVRGVLTPELQNDGTPDADQLIVSRLSGGQLQGLVEIRDHVFPALTDQLQELAQGLQFGLNAAHNDNVAWPQPGSLSGTRTDLSSFSAASRSGTATIAVIDANDGSTLLAFEVDIAAAVDETDLANQVNTSLGAFGTATIGADGQLEIDLAAANQGLAIAEGDSQITVTDAAGRDRDYGFSHYFGLNDLLVVDGSLPTDLAVRSDIVSDLSKVATAKLDVTTPPLTAALGGPGDNRGAQGLADALRADYDVIARGDLGAKSTDLGGYAAEIVANAATEAHQAETRARTDVALSDAVNFRAQSVSTVNLDEELASLMTLQQAYSVAARLISVVDELLSELVNTTR
jgi:flagellar hook-associated protein 1 FlgK